MTFSDSLMTGRAHPAYTNVTGFDGGGGINRLVGFMSSRWLFHACNLIIPPPLSPTHLPTLSSCYNYSSSFMFRRAAICGESVDGSCRSDRLLLWYLRFGDAIYRMRRGIIPAIIPSFTLLSLFITPSANRRRSEKKCSLIENPLLAAAAAAVRFITYYLSWRMNYIMLYSTTYARYYVTWNACRLSNLTDCAVQLWFGLFFCFFCIIISGA